MDNTVLQSTLAVKSNKWMVLESPCLEIMPGGRIGVEIGGANIFQPDMHHFDVSPTTMATEEFMLIWIEWRVIIGHYGDEEVLRTFENIGHWNDDTIGSIR